MTKRITVLLALIEKMKEEIAFIKTDPGADKDLLVLMYENLFTLENNLENEVKSHEAYE